MLQLPKKNDFQENYMSNVKCQNICYFKRSSRISEEEQGEALWMGLVIEESRCTN